MLIKSWRSPGCASSTCLWDLSISPLEVGLHGPPGRGGRLRHGGVFSILVMSLVLNEGVSWMCSAPNTLQPLRYFLSLRTRQYTHFRVRSFTGQSTGRALFKRDQQFGLLHPCRSLDSVGMNRTRGDCATAVVPVQDPVSWMADVEDKPNPDDAVTSLAYCIPSTNSESNFPCCTATGLNNGVSDNRSDYSDWLYRPLCLNSIPGHITVLDYPRIILLCQLGNVIRLVV